MADILLAIFCDTYFDKFIFMLVIDNNLVLGWHTEV